MIDANLNRAREAARVLEDVARFALNDRAVSEEAKSIRHALRTVAARLDQVLLAGWRESLRDVDGDVGTSIKANDEGVREGMHAIVLANAARLTEALRVIEESAKALGSECWRDAEALRYRAYALEQCLIARLHAHSGAQWSVCVILTRQACALPWTEVLDQALAAGADCIQIREKLAPTGDFLEHASRVVQRVRAGAGGGASGTPCPSVIINDRIDIAIASGADGVHLGQDDMPVKSARRSFGRSLLVGCSTHDCTEARAAVDAGADYCGVGTMFASRTKVRPLSGVQYLRDYLQEFASTPHLAIGGIECENIDELRAAGCRGVAVSSAVCGSSSPGEVVASLLRRVAAGSSMPTVGSA